MREPLDIMLRQYELLRAEINQCTLLRQAAVVGIFTTLVAGIGGLFALRSDLLAPGPLQLGAVGVVFLVNAFGSLYLHEQHRNRRVCAFVLILERLLTKAASDDTVSQGNGNSTVCPVMAWENFLVHSEASDHLNGPLYRARYLGVGLPILVLGVPLIVAAFSLLPSPELSKVWRGLPLLISCVSVLLLIGFALWEASQKEKATNKTKISVRSQPVRLFLKYLYICPVPILAVLILRYPRADILPSSGFSFPVELLVGVAFLSTFLGLWSAYVFFGIIKWLSEAEQGTDAASKESDVGRWLHSYYKRVARLNREQLMLETWGRFSTWPPDDTVEETAEGE